MTGTTPDILTVPAHEAGVLRVFALDASEPQLAAILPPHPIDAGHLAPLLGVDSLRDDDVERIAIRDLADYTLSEFLRIGHDIRSSDLEPCAAELDALKGHVLLIHSTAFAGAQTVLAPVKGLHPVAALRRNDAAPPPLTLPEAERPEILAPDTAATTRRPRSPWGLLILGLVLVVILIERLLS